MPQRSGIPQFNLILVERKVENLVWQFFVGYFVGMFTIGIIVFVVTGTRCDKCRYIVAYKERLLDDAKREIERDEERWSSL